MNLLEQPQVVCTSKLWYQSFFRGHFKVFVHNWQYICQYSINFKDSCTKNVMFLMLNIYVGKCLSYEDQQRSQLHATVI